LAGYSGKPIVQKLGIKPGFRIFVDGLSVGYDKLVGELPGDVRIMKSAKAPLDLVHLFAIEAKGLVAKLRVYRQAIVPAGMIWVSWPKRASGIASDLTDIVVRETPLPLGLVDVKVCAVDDDWSGPKFVIPVKQRGRAAK
jgi:hypothetical protein